MALILCGVIKIPNAKRKRSFQYLNKWDLYLKCQILRNVKNLSRLVAGPLLKYITLIASKSKYYLFSCSWSLWSWIYYNMDYIRYYDFSYELRLMTYVNPPIHTRQCIHLIWNTHGTSCLYVKTLQSRHLYRLMQCVLSLRKLEYWNIIFIDIDLCFVSLLNDNR